MVLFILNLSKTFADLFILLELNYLKKKDWFIGRNEITASPLGISVFRWLSKQSYIDDFQSTTWSLPRNLVFERSLTHNRWEIQPYLTRSKWNMGVGLKMMVKSGLENIYLRFLHAQSQSHLRTHCTDLLHRKEDFSQIITNSVTKMTSSAHGGI